MSDSEYQNKTTVRRSKKNGLSAAKAEFLNPQALNQPEEVTASESTKTDKSFALYELQHALTDGIFEARRRVKDAHLHFHEVVRETRLVYKDEKGKVEAGEPVTLKFLVPYSLNVQAESILLAIIKLSGEDGLRIEPDRPMLPFFTSEGDAKLRATVRTTTKQHRVLRAAGIGDDNKNYKLLEFYLDQMSHITVKWENHATGWRGTSPLMAYSIHDNGDLVAQLNWRLAGAIFDDYKWATIDLNERNTLEKDASKTLHRWLSAHLWAGKTEYITYDKLIGHIWTQEATPAAARKRLERLKNEVLPEIGKLDGWTVEREKDGARITHHKEPKRLPR